MEAKKRQTRPTRAWFFLNLVCVPIILIELTGCSSGPSPTDPSSFSQRQQAALNDPMGYKVPQSPDVSDDNTTSFDKPGFQRDVDHAINP